MANINHSEQPQPANQIVNSRRPPAHRSLSLLHSGPVYHSTVTAPVPQLIQKRSREHSTRANPPSTQSSRPVYQKDSSGESSNAERWFENNNINNMITSPEYMNDDAPFLLRNPSSEESPNGVSASINPGLIPYRTSVLPLATVASSSEDFRSVIDDLTIQNKNLKRRLRKFEKVQDAHLQQEKLFEVRMHGLKAEKKRELEDMLRKFVMDNCSTPPREPTSSRQGQHPLRNARKKSSSHASTRFGDSAYASMSGTNHASSATSHQHQRKTSQYGISASGLSSANSLQKKPPLPALTSRASGLSSSNSLSPTAIVNPGRNMSDQQSQTIHSYLHDIPLGLLPKNGTVNLSEKAKKKLVVRRLESIFAGKAPTPMGHQQALQQQEVSHSAVQADRQAMEESGQRMPEEGAREAQFMRKSKNSTSYHLLSATSKAQASKDEAIDITIDERDFAEENESSEQRPTRPLDLDFYRAQVPEDNIQYIRHLGFSPRDYAALSPPRDGHGWIYVNLLINMAQLHTLNVTPEFVRKAIGDMSTFLEISEDGRKLRWKGGADLTRTSSDGSPDSGNGQTHGAARNTTTSRGDRRPGSKLANSASNDGSSEMIRSVKIQSKDKLAYTPLFNHKTESDDEDDAEISEEEEISGWSSPRKNIAGDASGLASSGMRTHSSRKKISDDGPITFYDKANFCTDLSGDSRGKQLFAINNTNYSRLPTVPLGVMGADSLRRLSANANVRGPLSYPPATILEDDMETDSNPQVDDIDLKVIGASDISSPESDSMLNTGGIEFEASGIGGVEPRDHFAVHIKAKQQAAPVTASGTKGFAKLPPRLRKGLDEQDVVRSTSAPSEKSTFVRQEIVSVRCKNLPPSALPPPSFYPLSSPEYDSDDESDSGGGDAMSDVQLDATRPLPSAAPQLINLSSVDSSDTENDFGSEDETSEEEEIADDDRTDGIDLLAHARLLDPAAVIAREREYDCEMAERLAEDIPAGSSAATAGGGSGFNSPADRRDGEALGTARASRGAAVTPSLKRARENDSLSMAAHRAGRPRKSPKLKDAVSVSS